MAIQRDRGLESRKETQPKDYDPELKSTQIPETPRRVERTPAVGE
jgi:hypothetical protein